MKFEWDAAKAESNFKAHGVSFELAKTVFDDAFAIDRIDDREDYAEDRFVGRSDGQVLLFVVYAERGNLIRIIAARRVTKREEDFYFQQDASTDVQ